MYEVPINNYFRLHHPRSRFKSHVEEVLYFVALSISDLGRISSDEFDNKLDAALRMFPGNAGKKPKTIANWRTEISSLFGMMQQYDGFTSPTRTAIRLSKENDLISFFRHFLLTFQYPGGHVKPHEAANMIRNGVRFHPASFFIDVLLAGQEMKKTGSTFGISPAEATDLILYDLAVTAKHELTPASIAKTIISNRKSKVEYDRAGDRVRYAKDILDYMIIADLLTYRPATDSYSLNPKTVSAAVSLRNEAAMFDGYLHLYGRNPTAAEVKECNFEWIEFVNKERSIESFGANISDILTFTSDSSSQEVDLLFVEGIKKALEGNANDIGRVGEVLAIEHEQNRLRALGRPDLAKKVQKIPERFAVGYDLQSYEGQAEESGDTPLYVEVKTTRSKSKNVHMAFKMTKNEWAVCKASATAYCIYRILISSDGTSLFTIRNPFQHYVDGNLDMTIGGDGAEISFSEACGDWVELLLTKAAS
jgi:hypothetical protein